MKAKDYFNLVFFGMAFLVALAGCKDDSSSSSAGGPTPCAVSGTTVNIGSTTGGNYGANLGGADLHFNNINLNFTAKSSTDVFAPLTPLADVGVVSCLDEITSWPGGTAIAVAYGQGHGYVVKYGDNTYARFIANSYFDGVVSVTYEYPFFPQ